MERVLCQGKARQGKGVCLSSCPSAYMYNVYYTVYPELLEDNEIRRDGVNCGQVKIVNLAIIILAALCSSHNWCPTFLLVLSLSLSLNCHETLYKMKCNNH